MFDHRSVGKIVGKRSDWAKGDLGFQENFSVIFQAVFNCLSVDFQQIVSCYRAEKEEEKILCFKQNCYYYVSPKEGK